MAPRSTVATGRYRFWILFVGFAGAGCDPGTVQLMAPVGAGRQGSALEVRVVGPDEAPAAGATVHYFRRDRREETWHKTRTNEEGIARLEGLVPGAYYWVAAEQEDPRWGVLGGAEKAHAPSEAETSVELEVPLFTSRQGGVVISEMYMTSPDRWETGNVHYTGSHYFEVANTSGETIFLDGMLLGRMFAWDRDVSIHGHNACADTQAMRTDSLGIWSDVIWQFPGSGGEHPLHPGEVAVIAKIAADHTSIHPTMLDLSGAQFEFGLQGAADNPAAANMIQRGPFFLPAQHYDYSHSYWFLSAPADFAALPSACNPGSGQPCEEYRFIRRELLHDVFMVLHDYSNDGVLGPLLPPCDHPVHPSFDRMPGGFPRHFTRLDHSVQRRSVTVDGRPALLNTGTSRIDLEWVPRTPGWLP